MKKRKTTRRPARKNPAAAPVLPNRIRVSARVLPSTVAFLKNATRARGRKMGTVIADILDSAATK